MQRWMGIDLGTSGVKVLAVDERGVVLGRGQAAYVSSDSGRAHEQDAEQYVVAVHSAIMDCGVEPDGVAIVGQTPSLVLARGDMSPVRSVLTWRDTRPSAESAELVLTQGRSLDVFGADNLWDASQLPAKLLWLSRNDPEAIASARWLLQPKDYIGLRATGVAGTDAWSSKGLCSVSTQVPVEEVFDAAHADMRLLPEVMDPWSVLGTATAKAAEHLGLPKGCTIAVGWTDAMGGMLGIGAAVRPQSFVLTGTSDIVGQSFDSHRALSSGIYRVPASCSPTPIDYGPTQSSGASLAWLSRLVGKPVRELVASAEHARDTDAVFLPYLRGERAPIWDALVRGRFASIDESDGLPEITLAVMRGVALSDRHVLETCGYARSDGGIHVGGANVTSAGWTRAYVDSLDTDLLVHEEPQLPALGAAMLARSATTGSPITDSYECLRAKVLRVSVDAQTRSRARERFEGYLREVAHAMAAAHASVGSESSRRSG